MQLSLRATRIYTCNYLQLYLAGVSLNCELNEAWFKATWIYELGEILDFFY